MNILTSFFKGYFLFGLTIMVGLILLLAFFGSLYFVIKAFLEEKSKKIYKTKHVQTIVMSISLMLIILFFLPWFELNPDFQMFAASNMKVSGFSILKSIHYATPTVSLLGEAYGFPLASKLIYLGYIVSVLPIIGIISILLSGLKKPKALLFHMIHYCATAVFLTLFFILILINKDVRELFFAVMKVGFGSILSLLLAIVGIAFYFIKVK